jgi:Peptidase family C25/Propeptide_C25
MRRIFVLIIAVSLFMSAAGFADETTVAIAPGDPVFLNVLNADHLGLQVETTVNALTLRSERNGYGSFVRVRLADTSPSGTVGEPNIPVIRRFIEVPLGAEVTVEAEGMPMDLYPADLGFPGFLFPVQPSTPKTPDAITRMTFAFDSDSYETDTPRFVRRASVTEAGILRGRRLALLEIRPIDYNPVSGLISVYPELSVDVHFDHPDWDATDAARLRFSDLRTEGLLERLSINHDAGTKSGKDPIARPPVYLVLGPRGLVDSEAFAPWIEWKQQRGYHISIGYTDEIENDPFSVREYVLESYAEWLAPPAYLLIVGDTDSVPSFAGGADGNPDTDLYYVAIDGADYFPDLGIGRFPARTTAQVSHMVEKTILFEQTGWPGKDDWLLNWGFMAGNDNREITEGTHDWVCQNVLTPAGIDCEKHYVSRGADIFEVLDGLRDGMGMLAYSGHGLVNGWTDGPSMDQSLVMAMANDCTPFVCSFACWTGKYTELECFAETWMRVKYGAVGVWASSVTSFWEEDDILEKGQMSGLLGSDAGQSQIPEFSAFCDYGKLAVYSWAAGEGRSRRYFEMYNLFGDPETRAWTATPSKLTVEYERPVPVPADSFKFKVDGKFRNAMVGLVLNGRLIAGTQVSSGETVDLPLSEPISQEERAILTVTAHNAEPFQQTVLFSNNPFKGDNGELPEEDADSSSDGDEGGQNHAGGCGF